MWRDLEGVDRGGDAIVVGAGEGVRAIRATTIQTQIHGLDTLFVIITCLQGIYKRILGCYCCARYTTDRCE